MFTFILGILFLVGALVTFLFKYKREVGTGEYDTNPYNRREITETKTFHLSRWIPVGCVVVGLLFIGASMTTVVGPRNVGVVTTFGSVADDGLDSGLHVKSPFAEVTALDGTVQTLKFVGADGCIGVRIADNQIACVSVVQRSQINLDAAPELYSDYRSADASTDGDINDAINDALVRTQLTTALGSVFSDYDPLNDISDDGKSVAPDIEAFSTEVQAALTRRLGEASADGKPQVNPIQTTVTFIRFSDTTQKRIDAVQAQRVATQQAVELKNTNDKLALANQALADSLSNDPNVLVSRCLDIVENSDRELPAGFQCWNTTGGGAVVVPSSK